MTANMLQGMLLCYSKVCKGSVAHGRGHGTWSSPHVSAVVTVLANRNGRVCQRPRVGRLGGALLSSKELETQCPGNPYKGEPEVWPL